MHLWTKLPVIAAGSLLIALAVNLFIAPNRIMEGGLLGVCLALNYLFQINIGLAAALLSMPIYAWALFHRKSFIPLNLLGTLTTALLISQTAALVPGQPILPPLPSALAGGMLIGSGIGLMLLKDVSTDGIDLLAQLCGKKLQMNVGVLIFLFDLCIIACSILFLTRSQLILSGVTVATVGLMTTLITSYRRARLHR